MFDLSAARDVSAGGGKGASVEGAIAQNLWGSSKLVAADSSGCSG